MPARCRAPRPGSGSNDPASNPLTPTAMTTASSLVHRLAALRRRAATLAQHLAALRLALCIGVVSLAGCAGLPAPAPDQASTVIPASPHTALGAVAAQATAHPGLSGVRALPQAAFALDARFELIRRAQVSLDVQYYLVGRDDVGRALLRELQAAAARGVRVRLLIDDAYTVGMDALLLGLAAQQGVEVRLFNPFAGGRDSVAGRAFGAVGDLRRLNHRMHNKLLLADGAFAVVGGRNMADEYFQRHDEANFLDFDLLALGPVVGELAGLFDRYWNHPHVLPVQALARSGLDTQQLRDDFAREVHAAPMRPWPTVPPLDLYGDPPLGADLDRGLPRLIWAPASAFADTPDKVDFEGRPEQFATTVTHRTIESLREAASEIVLVSPYFIPGSAGVARLQEARQRGVTVRVITNSMAASDEPLVSVAYHRYRLPLLHAGVQLYELSPAQLRFDPRARASFGRSKGSLHAKLAFIDRRIVLLGSMNLDARSAWTNTELGLRIDSAELSDRIGGVPALATGRGAYQVRLADDGSALQWHALNAGADEPPLADEPEVGWLERLKLKFLSLFVAEDLL